MKKALSAELAVQLEQVPNVGPSIAGNLRQIGIERPDQLAGRDPYDLYWQLCRRTGAEVDRCVADVFISAVRFMEGAEARPWWAYTDERKRHMASGVART